MIVIWFWYNSVIVWYHTSMLYNIRMPNKHAFLVLSFVLFCLVVSCAVLILDMPLVLSCPLSCDVLSFLVLSCPMSCPVPCRVLWFVLSSPPCPVRSCPLSCPVPVPVACPVPCSVSCHVRQIHLGSEYFKALRPCYRSEDGPFPPPPFQTKCSPDVFL